MSESGRLNCYIRNTAEVTKEETELDYLFIFFFLLLIDKQRKYIVIRMVCLGWDGREFM